MMTPLLRMKFWIFKARSAPSRSMGNPSRKLFAFSWVAITNSCAPILVMVEPVAPYFAFSARPSCRARVIAQRSWKSSGEKETLNAHWLTF